MKRTPLRRLTPLTARPREPKPRTRVKPVSDRRRSEAPARAQCRAVVLSRDRECRGYGTLIHCTKTSTEVHELGRGAYRQTCYLDPELCIGLCHSCHAWVTGHPDGAHNLGLALWGWEVQQILDRRPVDFDASDRE